MSPCASRHEAIYQSLYVQGRGALRRELTACLRTGRALRRPRRRVDERRERIKDKVMISERPAEADDRAVPGHWEGDLIVGEDSGSAIGTLVERTTRFVMLLHLPADHGAEAVRDAIVAQIITLPAALRRSLTWDQGIEMARHAEITIAADLPVYFCDPHSPWQRGTQREHQRAAPPVLPQRQRPLRPRRRPPRRDRRQSSTAAPARPSASRPQPKPSPSYSPTIK